jgi:uncharacterized protein (TIGR04141 family)
MKPVQVGGQSALLVQGSIDTPEAKWSQTLSTYTGQSVSLGNSTAAALLLVPRANRVLALSYGMGWLLLDQSQVEQGFGLRYAVRALDAGQVRQVTRHLLSTEHKSTATLYQAASVWRTSPSRSTERSSAGWSGVLPAPTI